MQIGRDELHAVRDTLATADLSGTAEVVGRYEQEAAAWFDARFAVACSSGTAAIHLALLALGVGPGAEVIVPATAPAMTALPVLAVGAVPVFADVAHPATFALNLADVAGKLTARTKAVIAVPMWGYPADGPELAQACRSWVCRSLKTRPKPMAPDCSVATLAPKARSAHSAPTPAS